MVRTRTSELLRIATAGSVDDGKSTLIGRLLHDSKAIFEDQLEHVQQTSERRGDGYLNLALLTDGLRAEREQGITIDVAYRYFATPRRKFIIADTPGDEHHDYRGYAGQVAGGVLRPGGEVVVLPGGQRTTVQAIDTYAGEVEAAFPTMSVALRFADEIDVSRGDMVVEAEDQPVAARE